jgi:hypothetical protein
MRGLGYYSVVAVLLVSVLIGIVVLYDAFSPKSENVETNTVSQPIEVSISDLVSNPGKYVGKEIITRGYLRAIIIDKFIENKTEIQYFLEENALRVQLSFAQPPSFTEINKVIKVRGVVNKVDETLLITVNMYEKVN